MITRILGPFYQVIHVVQNQHTREQEGNLEKTTKKNTILNDVSSLFLLSQCVPSSLAWRFCTTRTAKRLIQVMIWPIPRAGTKKQMVTSYGLSKRSGFSRLVHLFTSTSFNSRSIKTPNKKKNWLITSHLDLTLGQQRIYSSNNGCCLRVCLHVIL